MKAILAKLAVRKVVGLYITDRELTLTRVALTPLGPVEMDRKRESYNPDEIGVVLDRLLKPLLNRRKSFRIHVAIGLPAQSRLLFDASQADDGPGDVSRSFAPRSSPIREH